MVVDYSNSVYTSADHAKSLSVFGYEKPSQGKFSAIYRPLYTWRPLYWSDNIEIYKCQLNVARIIILFYLLFLSTQYIY